MDAIRIQIPEHVVSEPLDGEAVVLNLKTGQYYGLNRTGSFVWRQIEAGSDVARIKAAMAAKYPTATEALEADLSALLTELERRGLIVLTGGNGLP